MTKFSITTQTRLDELATEIQEATAKCYSVAMDSLKHAKEAGELLAESKNLCRHGEWEKWVQEKCNLATRTVRAYMQVANAWPEIEAKRHSDAVLGFIGATKLIATPKEKRKKKVTESQTSETEESEPFLQPPGDQPTEEGPEGEIPPEFEKVFATRHDFNNIVRSVARLQEIPFILRNNIYKIETDFFPKIVDGIDGFPMKEFHEQLKAIEKTINSGRLQELVNKFLDDLKYFKPHAVCSCYKDGKADPGCERCIGTGYRSKDE